MRAVSNLSDLAILKELGSRIARYRLNKNMTQQALGDEAGVSLPTLQRIEQGDPTSIVNILRLLRALGLLDNLDLLVPPPPVSPIMQRKLAGKTRQRAARQKVAAKQKEGAASMPGTINLGKPWTWGEE